jgi:hypothetical protein
MPDLETLLDETRDALLAGDLLRLAALTAQLDQAAPAADPAPLARSRRKAARNAALLEAALKGIRAARRRATELAQPGRFSTYDATGRRGALGTDPCPPALRF